MKKKERNILIFATIVLFFVSAVYVTRGRGYGTLAIIALLAYMVCGIYVIACMIKRKKANKSVRLQHYDATLTGRVKHINGLPLAKGVLVDMYYGPEKILFKKNGEEITVKREKVASIDLVSAGNNTRNAMAGAATGKYVIGGTAGAVVGSLAALKYNLVISYVSDGKAKSITVDTASSGAFPTKVVNDFNKTAPYKHNSVEL